MRRLELSVPIKRALQPDKYEHVLRLVLPKCNDFVQCDICGTLLLLGGALSAYADALKKILCKE